MKTVKGLSREQLVELKQSYLGRLDEEGILNQTLYGEECDIGLTSMELADADNLVSDEKIFEEYAGTSFTDDDFYCTEGVR